MRYAMTGKVAVMRKGAMDELAMAGERRGWGVSGSGDKMWLGAVFGLVGVGNGPSGCCSLDGPLE